MLFVPVENIGSKKQYLNLYVAQEVKVALERHSKRERRSLSNLCDGLLGWAAQWLEKAGDLNRLQEWHAVPKRESKARVSAETQDHLHMALDAILAEAPSTVVQRVNDFLVERAVRYGYQQVDSPSGVSR